MKILPSAAILAALLALGLFTAPAQQQQQTNSGTTLNNVTPACGITLSGPDWIVVNDDDDNDDAKWDCDIEPVAGEDDTGMLTVVGAMPATCTGTATVEVAVVGTGLQRIAGFRPGKQVIRNSAGDIIAQQGDDAQAREKRVPKSHPFTFNVNPGQSVTVHLWIEGIKHSESGPPDVLIEAKTSYSVCGVHGECGPVTHSLSVYQADLDVDSFNDHGLAFAGFTKAEDEVETSAARSGKIVLPTSLVNSDRDELGDYADGFNLVGAQPLAEPAGVASELKFVPVRCEIMPPFEPDSANATFTFPHQSVPAIAAEGLSVSGAGTEESPRTIAVNAPGYRLWRTPPDARGSGLPIPKGDWIPADTQIKWSDLFAAGGEAGRVAELYLEYVDTNPPVLQGRSPISMKIEQGYGITFIDTVDTWTRPADLDVDSDNNNDNAPPDRTGIEEGYQHAPDRLDASIQKPGKILVINDGDTDHDGIPDYADGFSDMFESFGLNASIGAADGEKVPQSRRLVPVVIDIPAGTQGIGQAVENMLVVKFQYDASDPAAMTRPPADETRTRYELPEDGTFRLWTTDAGKEELRSKLPADTGGHFITNGMEIPWPQLRDMLETNAAGGHILWVESVKPSKLIRDQEVTISVGVSSGGITHWTYTERVHFTTVGTHFATLNNDGSTTRDKGYTMSHTSPVIALTKNEVGDPEYDWHDGWQVDIDLEGRITSDFLYTVTEAQGGTLDKVYLHLNNNDEPFAEVAIVNNKDFNPDSLTKPFPYLGTFAYQGRAVGAVDGKNILTIRTKDRVFQNDGMVIAAFVLDLPVIDSEALGIPPPPPPPGGGESAIVIGTIPVSKVAHHIELLDGLSPDSTNHIEYIHTSLLPPSDAVVHPMTETGPNTRFFREDAFLIHIYTPDFNPDPEVMDWFEAHFYTEDPDTGELMLQNVLLFQEYEAPDSNKYAALITEYGLVAQWAGAEGTPIPGTEGACVEQPVIVYQSDGGEFHPQVMEVTGPPLLIAALASVKFSDLTVVDEGELSVGFETRIKEANDKMFLANTEVPDAMGIVCFRENLEGDQFPLISEQIYASIAKLQTKSLYPDSWGSFGRGFAVGVAKGGVDMVGGVVAAGKAAVKIAAKAVYEGGKACIRAHVFQVKVIFKFVTGQSIESEVREAKDFVTQVSKKADGFFNLAGEGLDVAKAILAGDFKRLDSLSGTMRNIVQAGVEIFAGLADAATGGAYDRHSQPNCRGTLIPVGDSLKSDFFCSHHNEKISENFC